MKKIIYIFLIITLFQCVVLNRSKKYTLVKSFDFISQYYYVELLRNDILYKGFINKNKVSKLIENKIYDVILTKSNGAKDFELLLQHEVRDYYYIDDSLRFVLKDLYIITLMK